MMSENNLTMTQQIIVDKLKSYDVKIYLFGEEIHLIKST